MLTSVGSSTSSMPVIELTVVPPSLIESAAMCECASMMPGVTKRPFASTTSAPAGMSVPGSADGGDLAVAQDDHAVLNRAARDGQDRAAANRDHRWPRRLRERRLLRRHERQSDQNATRMIS